MITTYAEDLVMGPDNSTITILKAEIDLGRTQPTRNNRLTKEPPKFTHEIFGVTRPEIFRSILVVGDHLIDVRISLLRGMTKLTSGTVLLEHRREEPGKTLETIHVLLLVRDDTHNRADNISPRGLVHVIFPCFDDPTAKEPAVSSL